MGLGDRETRNKVVLGKTQKGMAETYYGFWEMSWESTVPSLGSNYRHLSYRTQNATEGRKSKRGLLIDISRRGETARPNRMWKALPNLRQAIKRKQNFAQGYILGERG